MKCYLIRHGQTYGNTQLHFNGCGTDEPLTEDGRKALTAITDADEDAVLFASPMKRALETASIMLPDKVPEVIEDLREMDFGRFEGRNHKMLDGDPDYQAWLDSGGTAQIPGGENLHDFKTRIMKGFAEAVRRAAEAGAQTVYIVAHGGTIMAAMNRLTGESYFGFNPPNGAGYEIELEVDDAGNVLAATSYDRFCGGLRAGSDGWRPPQYTPSRAMDGQTDSSAR